MSRMRALVAALLFAPAAGALQVTVQDQAGRPVANAVVFARGPAAAAAPATAVIDQIHKRYVPEVSVIAAGTAVQFPNKDDIKHHVYSFSPAKTFELKLYHGIPAEPVVFDKAGIVVLGCNIHDNMIAYVYVVDAPYFALTDAAGTAQLAGLPAGTLQIVAWHYQMQSEAQAPTVAVTADAPPVVLTVPLSGGKRRPPPLE